MDNETISSTLSALIKAIDDGIIDLNNIKHNDEDMERKDIIEIEHPFSIWNGRNGYWYTYIEDFTKKKNRRLVKKRYQTELFDVIREEFIIRTGCGVEKNRLCVKLPEKNEEIDIKQIKFRKLYLEWIKYKANHTNSTSYIAKITTDWNKFYKNNSIANMYVYKMDSLYVDEWIHKTIKKYELTSKQYYNMSVIVRQSLEYAVKKGYLEKNPFIEFKVNSKMFRKTLTKENHQEVFLTNEEQLVKDAAAAKIKINRHNTNLLGILLAFEIGARVGELSALRFSDVKDKYIHIQRQQVKTYKLLDDGSVITLGYKIVNFTKSDAGDRRVYLTERARNIIDQIQAVNEERRFKINDQLFLEKVNARDGSGSLKMRVSQPLSFEKELYSLCDENNISKKGIHKIRKTYISTLIDGGVNINKIMEYVGHSDEKTTYKNYCFNRYTDTETENQVESALHGNKSSNH